MFRVLFHVCLFTRLRKRSRVLRKMKFLSTEIVAIGLLRGLKYRQHDWLKILEDSFLVIFCLVFRTASVKYSVG